MRQFSANDLEMLHHFLVDLTNATTTTGVSISGDFLYLDGDIVGTPRWNADSAAYELDATEY